MEVDKTKNVKDVHENINDMIIDEPGPCIRFRDN